MIAKAKAFLSEVRSEVKRVTWPSRKDTMGGTMVVLMVVLLASIYLGVLDAIFSKIIQSMIAN